MRESPTNPPSIKYSIEPSDPQAEITQYFIPSTINYRPAKIHMGLHDDHKLLNFCRCGFQMSDSSQSGTFNPSRVNAMGITTHFAARR